MASFEIDLDTDGAQGAASKLTDSMGGLVKSMSGAGAGSDGLTSKMGTLTESMDPVSLACQVAVAALVALAGALIAGGAAAISITQQRDALRNTFDALGGGAGAGEKTLAMLDRMSKTLPFTTDQLAKWAKGLEAAGIQGPALEQSIKAVASATAIMGETGGAAAQKLISKLAEAAAVGGRVKIDKAFTKQLAASGVSVDALAKALGTTPDKLAKMNLSAKQLGDAMQKALIQQGAGPLADLGLTWDSISSKLKDGIASAFEGLGPDVKAFMNAVKSLFGEFSRGTTTANGMKAVVTAVFHTLFTVAVRVVNAIHTGFLKLQIAFYKAEIALRPIINAIKKLIPAGAGVSILMAGVKALAVVFALLAVAVFISITPLILLGAVILAAAYALYEIGAAVVAAVDWLMGLGEAAGTAGVNFIQGLVNSISGGASAVVAAVVGVAKGAVAALKGALGIASPSKVAIGVGSNVTGTLADTVADGADDVHAAARGTGQAVAKGMAAGTDGAAGAAGAAGSGGSSGLSIVVQAGAIVIHGAGDALALTEEALSILLERIALQRGLVSP